MFLVMKMRQIQLEKEIVVEFIKNEDHNLPSIGIGALSAREAEGRTSISGGGEKVGAQTETELKEKKLRVEDALNATKLLRKDSLDNDEEKVGADIVKRALSYPLKLIAKNVGVNGSVVSEKVLSSDNPKYGYNAATSKYEDLMAAGIIDPTKVSC
ncbi:hypothetical protein RIF29_04573 [Crotalaria pallida]|uniref:Uncharacterized protein n=1 Tax=Crotalaria pallida TaxID=3830 RepID=A0AAN9J3M6_CROPI